MTGKARPCGTSIRRNGRPAFTIRYWSVIAVMLGVPIVLIAAVEATRDGRPLAGLASPGCWSSASQG